MEERTYQSREIEPLSYEEGLYNKVNKTLVNNFNKVAEWIKENCPHLNGKFECRHNPYYWVALVVENGKAYLEEGSHGYRYSTALSVDGTLTMSAGSSQCTPFLYKEQFFKNERLEEFLKNWKAIKDKVISENEIQSNIYSDNFVA